MQSNLEKFIKTKIARGIAKIVFLVLLLNMLPVVGGYIEEDSVASKIRYPHTYGVTSQAEIDGAFMVGYQAGLQLDLLIIAVIAFIFIGVYAFDGDKDKIKKEPKKCKCKKKKKKKSKSTGKDGKKAKKKKKKKKEENK